MRLSTFSDYSLRVLLYLGARPERLANIAEIAAGHDISESHLMKVVLHLGRCGYIQTLRGKGGGMRLAKAPADIVLGDVLRQTETDFELVDCLGSQSTCRIAAGCGLKAVFNEALEAMFLVLDTYTLADLLQHPQALIPTAPPVAAAEKSDA